MEEQQHKIEKQLLALKEQSKQERQKLKKLSAVSLIFSGLLVSITFLLVLYFSPKRSLDLVVVGGALVGSLFLIGWGLKRLLF